MLHKKEDGGILWDLLVLSEKRKNLFLLLRGGSKTLQEIKDYLHITSPGIISQIHKMEEMQLIYRINKKYALTEMGEVLAEYLYKFENILRLFGEKRKFWSEHEISAIPLEFRNRLHELGNFILIESTPTDIFRPQNEFMKNLMKAKWLKGVSPVLHPQYPEYVFDLAEKGEYASIIVTRELLDKLKEEHKLELERGMGYKNTNIMLCDEKIGFSFTVTDFSLTLRLFMNDGTYDFSRNIVSFDKSALKWGEDLFSYYEKHSKKIGIQDI